MEIKCCSSRVNLILLDHEPGGRQSLCNRTFGGVFVLSLCTLYLFVGIGFFIIGLSQISIFLFVYFITLCKCICSVITDE